MEGGEQHHEGGHAGAVGQVLDAPQQFGVDGDVDVVGAEPAGARSGPVGGQGQWAGAGQPVAPGGEFGRVGGRGDRGQRGGRAEGRIRVQGAEFGEEHTQRPAVGHDVVGEQLEAGGAVGEGPDGDAPQRAGREVHGFGGAGVGGGAGLVVAGVGAEVAQVGDGQIGCGVGFGCDGAGGAVPLGEGGAQHGVPPGERAQGGGEAVRVDGAFDLCVEAQDVRGRTGVDLLEQPQSELDGADLGVHG